MTKVIHVPRSTWWLLLVLYLPLCGKTKGVLQHKPMIRCQAIKDLTFIWNLKISKKFPKTEAVSLVSLVSLPKKKPMPEQQITIPSCAFSKLNPLVRCNTNALSGNC